MVGTGRPCTAQTRSDAHVEEQVAAVVEPRAAELALRARFGSTQPPGYVRPAFFSIRSQTFTLATGVV